MDHLVAFQRMCAGAPFCYETARDAVAACGAKLLDRVRGYPAELLSRLLCDASVDKHLRRKIYRRAVPDALDDATWRTILQDGVLFQYELPAPVTRPMWRLQKS